MSVTIYLTDHHGRKVAFFYRIDSERYSTAPQLIWCCRDHPEYQGTAESKEHFMEQCKDVMKQLNRSPKVCKDCGLTSNKFESQDTCPECLTDD
jgi:predicted Zn-ribbon and HTH transcriptional regulator